jgi:hypothetical protein
VLQQGEELIVKRRGRGGPFWRRPGVRSSNNGGGGKIEIRACKVGFRGVFLVERLRRLRGIYRRIFLKKGQKI